MDEISLQLITCELNQSKDTYRINKYSYSNQNEHKTYKDLLNFIDRLKENMHKKRYRVVLTEINNADKQYEQLPEYFIVNLLKARSLLKIIERKIAKYSNETKDLNSHQRNSIEFWFNQLYYMLQSLTDYIGNAKCSQLLKTEEYLNIVECIVLLYSNTLHQLAIMTWSNQDIHETCGYIGIAGRLIPYANYMRNPKTLHIFQRILLFEIRIFLCNKDLAAAFELIEKCSHICFKEFFLLMNYDESFINPNIKKNKNNVMIYQNVINLVLIYYQRGAYFEKTGKILKAIESYKQSRYLCRKYFQISQPELTLFLNRITERATQIHIILESITKNINHRRDRLFKKLSLDDKKNKEVNTKAIRQYSCKDNLVDLPVFANTLREIDKINSKEDVNGGSNCKSKYPKATYITSTVRLIDNLLSPDLQSMVNKMSKIEISTFDKDTVSKIRKQSSEGKQSAKERSMLRNSNNNNHNRLLTKHEPSFKYNPDKVEKYTIDKDNFSRSYIKKKQFLEQYSNRELCFHKKLLTLKKSEKSVSRGRFNPQNVAQEIEDFFFVKSTLAKAQQKKTVFQNLISRNSTQNLLKRKERSLSCSNMFTNKITSTVRASIFDFVPSKSGYKEYDKQTANDINFLMLRKITMDYDHIENNRKQLEGIKKEKRRLNKSHCN